MTPRDHDDIDWERLDRYVSGEGSPQEREELERWVTGDPTLSAIVAAMRTIGSAHGATERRWDVPSAWMRMKERMGRGPVHSLQVLRAAGTRDYGEALAGRRRRLAWRIALTAAAALLIVAAPTIIVRLREHARAPEDTTTVPPRQIATGRGERAVFDFADGSRAILGPQSRLTIRPGFNRRGSARPRDVLLQGEAYFRVRHDSLRPFRVLTATAVTEDVGTAFVVSAYPGTHDTRVVVEEGSVAMRRPAAIGDSSSNARSEKPLVVLVAGDLARLTDEGVATLVSNVKVSSYLAWTRGTLVFDGTRLADAIPHLERWYDLDIKLGDTTLADRKLSGSFENESEQQMLQELSVALSLRVARSGRSVVLTPMPRKTPSAK